MDVPLLARTEDQKTKSAAVWWLVPTFGSVCESMITNSTLCFMVWLHNGTLDMESLTPSQAADGRALLRVLLWLSVAAVVAVVLALRQPAGRRIRLDLAHVALAFTAATHCVTIWLLFFVAARASQESPLLLSLSFLFALADIIFLVALNHGHGEEEEE